MLAQVLHLSLRRNSRAVRTEPAPSPADVALVLVRTALARVEARVPKKKKRVRVVPEEEERSDWDPEPVSRSPFVVRTPYEEEMLQQEIHGCKNLLLEMVRRAAYDWVLYRGSRRMLQKSLADQAYRWLFLEVPGTADWLERERVGKFGTSFIAVCESLDLEPDKVRGYIKQLTAKNVQSVGRPAEYHRRDVFSARSGDNDVYATPGILVEYDETDESGEDPSY